MYLSLVSCRTSPVSRLLSHVSCHNSPVSRLTINFENETQISFAGSVSLLLASLGCVGAWKEKSHLLNVFAVILAILAIGEFSDGRNLNDSVADLDPHKSGTFTWIRIHQKVKEQINKTVNSELFVL